MKHTSTPIKKVITFCLIGLFLQSIRGNSADKTYSMSSTTSFMVLADLHYFDPSLLIADGTAFQNYLARDRKMLQESQAILEAAIDTIKALRPNFLLVAGDLTKDGEKVSHQSVANYFKELEDAGISVFITPGNHDINNPLASSFNGSNKTQVPTITPEDFTTIYADYGYNEASKKDTASLSYMAEYNNIIILSLDACHYNNNSTYPETAGSLKESTLIWILDRLSEAKSANKQVIAVMHHGILEHYTLQASVMSEYIIEDWDNISTTLADAGLHVVFTGHNHSQDITKKVTGNGAPIWDVETGSILTYPVPFRYVSFQNDSILKIDGGSINNVSYNGQLYPDFETYSYEYLDPEFQNLVKQMLINSYGLNNFTASLIAPVVTNAFLANYKGDEGEPSANDQLIIQQLATYNDSNSKLLAATINSLWTDLPPSDWQTSINLNEKSTSLSAETNKTLESNSVIIFPNPAKEVTTALVNGRCEIDIFNLKGQHVYHSTLEKGRNNLLLDQLSSGIYVCKIATASKTIHRKLIIK